MADLVKKEADKMKKIGDVQRGITKNTSQSTLNSKMKQVENYQKELSRILSDKATINQKLADKRKRRVDAAGKLQKEELAQANKVEKQQRNIYEVYEQQIKELQEQIERSREVVKNERNIYDSDSEEEYDVFVSHATEDKEGFSDAFVRILQEKYNLKVWYDAVSIKWGIVYGQK